MTRYQPQFIRSAGYDPRGPNGDERWNRLPATSPVVAVPASGPGALAGFESRCECGLVIRSSLETMARADRAEHVRWHAARGR